MVFYSWNMESSSGLDEAELRFERAWEELLPKFQSLVREKVLQKLPSESRDSSKAPPASENHDLLSQPDESTLNDDKIDENESSEDDSSDEEGLHSTQGLAERSSIDPALVTRLKKVVVNVEQYVEYALGNENVGAWTGTGVIVDKKNGLILTNEHIAGQSPQRVKVTFENGDTCSGLGPVYSDPWHDFAFYKFDPAHLDFAIDEAILGTSFDLKEQDELFMIGNNEGEEYSIKFGRVVNMKLNRGDRHSSAFQTSFDRTGGSSGSPVFDVQGRVVGLHMRGTNTTSIELRIEYAIDALEQMIDKESKVLKKDFSIRRGEIGAVLDLKTLSNCVQHLRFPPACSAALKETFGSQEIKHAVVLWSTIPFSESQEAGLKPGDIIWKVNDQLIGDNIYLFDKIVDSWVGGYVTCTFFRNGQQMTVKVDVRDAIKENTIRKFALLAGGVFHDITPYLRHKYEISTRGVYLSQVAVGSSLGDLGSGSDKHPTKFIVVVEELDGKPTPNLESFILVIRELTQNPAQKQFHIYALCRDYRDYASSVRPIMFTLDIKFGSLRLFSFDSLNLEWIESSQS